MERDNSEVDGVFFWTGVGQREANDLVSRFHYSHRVPANVQCVVTAHERGGLFGDRGRAIAAVFFSIPPTRWSEDVWELSRLVRRDDADLPLTSLIAEACNIIRRHKSMDLLVSYADSTHGHHGGIYQAASWCFNGFSPPKKCGLIIAGEYMPARSANSRFGTRSVSRLKSRHNIDAEDVRDTGKYLYWRALTRSGKKKAARLGLVSMPYPKPDNSNNASRRPDHVFERRRNKGEISRADRQPRRVGRLFPERKP